MKFLDFVKMTTCDEVKLMACEHLYYTTIFMEDIKEWQNELDDITNKFYKYYLEDKKALEHFLDDLQEYLYMWR